MISTRSFANAFYGAWGIGPGSQDGQYYVPCDLAMNVSLTLGQGVSVVVPIHPIDLSFAIQSQPQSSTCLGALQASDTPISQGDLILGAAFLRNVYTILSFETDPPQLGILPLTNPTTALEEFNTVRVMHQPIGSGLSPSQGSGSVSSGTVSTSGNNQSTKVGLKILGGVVGSLILAVLLLCFSVRLLRNRMTRQIAGQEGKEARDEQDAKLRNMETQLQYGGEEAFAMFGGKSDWNTGRTGVERPSLKSSDTQSIPPEDVFHQPQPPEVRRSSESLFSPGAFKDSRYPQSFHSKNSSLKSLDETIPPLRALEYSARV